MKGVTQAPQPQQGALRLWEATISGAGADHTAWMGLAPFENLDGAHFLVRGTLNEVHSAFPAHQVARQP